jgi:hypothetical protein
MVFKGPILSARKGINTRVGRPTALIMVVRRDESAKDMPTSSWPKEASFHRVSS